MAPATVAAFAPGRVNLIGEHTDYEQGLCLPFAVAEGVTVTAAPAAGRDMHVLARELGEDRFPAGRPEPADGWRAFVRGTVGELARSGVEMPPLRLEITATLPRGTGLSSSAALCVALALALLEAAGAPRPDAVALARLCSRVENDWAGARTGLLDQLASLLGEEGRAIRLDMRSPEDHHAVPVALGAAQLATFDSGASRELAGSGYNRRRAECREAAEGLGVGSLRDAAEADAGRLAEPLAARVRHVTSENARVEAMEEALRAADADEAGRLLDVSHASLRDDFEVSVPEVERTVEAVKGAGALGARIMGGGFGGSVLALFPPGAERPAGGLRVAPSAGARLL